MEKFEAVTQKQLREFMARTARDHQNPIGRHALQQLLDGRLADYDGVPASRVINTRPLVEAMIRAGLHKVTNGGTGMKAAIYRNLWPKTVAQPLAYVGRFDQVLLVDTTVELAVLVEHGKVAVYTDPALCEDVVRAPALPDHTRLRYVVFFQDGKTSLGRTVEECGIAFAGDELGLTTREGLHLSIQHESILRDHGVDLPGSRAEDWRAPCVGWFGHGRPEFRVSDIRRGDPHYGSASRGSIVIPVP